jgi:hypothetical protein
MLTGLSAMMPDPAVHSNEALAAAPGWIEEALFSHPASAFARHVSPQQAMGHVFFFGALATEKQLAAPLPCPA